MSSEHENSLKSLPSRLAIRSPKRAHSKLTGWDSLFPYYAGYSEQFAKDIVSSAEFDASRHIFDPWNGSGTTTHASYSSGIKSTGLDINPVMIVVSKARNLPKSEASSLFPLALQISKRVEADTRRLSVSSEDPLFRWFSASSTYVVRRLEREIFLHLVDDGDSAVHPTSVENFSCVASALYVCLFESLKNCTKKFGTTNPSWIREKAGSEEEVSVSKESIIYSFLQIVRRMATVRVTSGDSEHQVLEVESRLLVRDTSELKPEPDALVDLIVTSPPYCTRLDYSAATRLELAVIDPVVSINRHELGRSMLGSTRVPHEIRPEKEEWGDSVLGFLRNLRTHESTATRGYYYRTNTDYFDKACRSMQGISSRLVKKGCFVLVIQDSYHKGIHNNLAKAYEDIGSYCGLSVTRREDFAVNKGMSSRNIRSKKYGERPGPVESVIVLQKV